MIITKAAQIFKFYLKKTLKIKRKSYVGGAQLSKIQFLENSTVTKLHKSANKLENNFVVPHLQSNFKFKFARLHAKIAVVCHINPRLFHTNSHPKD